MSSSVQHGEKSGAGKVMSLLPKKKPTVQIAAPAPHQTFGTTDKARDGLKVDGRKLRATGRTAQFATRVTEQTLQNLNALAKQHGMQQNELLTAMVNAWKERDGLPPEEVKAGRNQPLTICVNHDVLEGLNAIAGYHKSSIHAIIEDLVAERLERLQGAGDIPKMRAAKR